MGWVYWLALLAWLALVGRLGEASPKERRSNGEAVALRWPSLSLLVYWCRVCALVLTDRGLFFGRSVLFRCAGCSVPLHFAWHGILADSAQASLQSDFETFFLGLARRSQCSFSAGNFASTQSGPAVLVALRPRSTLGGELTMESIARLNGHVQPRTRKSQDKPKTARPRKLSTDQRTGLVVAAPGLALLALSVQHCTESISLLTGAPQYQSCLMALGIDAGMVACEFAALRLVKAKRGSGLATTYIVWAVLLSMLLNAYSFGLHAPSGMVWAAWAFGVSVPALVYLAGRVAGQMWLRE